MLETLRQATTDTVRRDLCFFSINDQRPRYMGFEPLYAYFILTAYPEARAVVVSSYGFPEEVHETVSTVQRELGVPASSVQLVFTRTPRSSPSARASPTLSPRSVSCTTTPRAR